MGYLDGFRQRFHPLNHLRRHALTRAVLKAMDIPIWTRLPGVRWKVRVRLIRHASWFVLSDGVEPWAVELVREIVRRSAIQSFWDIGANVGYYAWLVKSIAPHAEIRIFEPDPNNLMLIRKTLRRTSLTDVTVRDVAVSEMRGRRHFALDEISGATGGMREGGVTYSERYWGVTPSTVTVETVSIDEERTATRPVDLVKIDVEGHEEAVIRGALQTVRNDQPILIFECFHGANEIIDQLRPLGYWVGDAERWGPHTGSTTNFLALPMRHHELLDGFVRCPRDGSGRGVWQRGTG